MFWNSEAECMPLGDLRRLQARGLQATVRRAHTRSERFRTAMRDAGMAPEDVTGLEQLQDLPFTTRHDLQSMPAMGLDLGGGSRVAEYHASSGTTGIPRVTPYTRSDLEGCAEAMARVFAAAGVSAEDTVQNAFGYGLFIAGFAFHYGAVRIGASVIPASAGNTLRQLRLMAELGTTVLCCTPTYAFRIAEVAEEASLDVHQLRLRVGLFGAEPWSGAARSEIEARLGLRAYDSYGLSEIGGVAYECEERNGYHVNQDQLVVEIVDPESGTPLPAGSWGELVFTALTKEAIPLIRYRTGDLSALMPDRCPCGRTTVRIGPITGRTDDMLVVRGVNVFPSQIEAVLMQTPELSAQYVIVREGSHGMTEGIDVWVELRRDPPGCLTALTERVRDSLRNDLGISVGVTLLPPNTLPRSEGKSKRVVDRAELGTVGVEGRPAARQAIGAERRLASSEETHRSG